MEGMGHTSGGDGFGEAPRVVEKHWVWTSGLGVRLRSIRISGLDATSLIASYFGAWFSRDSPSSRNARCRTSGGN
ncbi:hypothetical protein ABZV14_11165 [Streptosporangium canum]|uniref:hypothetical protein n=1 Tax=Streptosporangium canum TaxID=324952 RepID=UPI0033AB6B3B